jgi:ketosteroid isomerase-like protein
MNDERLLELTGTLRRAYSTFDLDALRSITTPGYAETYPQSREIVRGLDAMVRLLAEHPARPRIMSPTRLTIVGEETVAAEELAMYGDEPWWIIAILSVADAKVTGERSYYGRRLEPPAWRAGWVVPIPDDEPPADPGGHQGVDRDTVEAYFHAVAASDDERLSRLRHPEFVHDMPQSGERFPTPRAFAEANAAYPGGGPTLTPLRVSGPQDEWVVGAGAGPLRVSGRGPHWIAEAELVYPNGDRWFEVLFMDFRDGKVVSERSYWADPFEAPAWRDGISERY